MINMRMVFDLSYSMGNVRGFESENKNSNLELRYNNRMIINLVLF